MFFRRLLIPAIFVLAVLILPLHPVRANIDCNYPVTAHTWTGLVKSGVNVHDQTCTDSTVIHTLQGGLTVPIVGEADGWYQVQLSDGTTGFVWQDFVTITSSDSLPAQDTTDTTPVSDSTPATQTTTTPQPSGSLLDRVRGRILLQVQANGEAWYVDPVTALRFYMKDGPTAYEMMRSFGLGISNADLAKAQAGDSTILNHIKGRIVLQVESLGEAYYVLPTDLSLHYLKDGDAAYQVMRQLSLGITDSDLLNVPSGDFTAYQKGELNTASQATSLGPVVSTTTPAGLDLDVLNQYWLDKINTLRAAAGLRQLVIDPRWRATATEWADYNASLGYSTHTRPDGKTMHQWIDTKGLDFTIRYSPDGWKTNYFTENIGYGYISEATNAAVEKALDEILAYYLSEAATNGAHYRTIYHPDWNSVGVGLAFGPSPYGGYKVYEVFHYGSLVLN